VAHLCRESLAQEQTPRKSELGRRAPFAAPVRIRRYPEPARPDTGSECDLRPLTVFELRSVLTCTNSPYHWQFGREAGERDCVMVSVTFGFRPDGLGSGGPGSGWIVGYVIVVPTSRDTLQVARNPSLPKSVAAPPQKELILGTRTNRDLPGAGTTS
jgi:hypothetical protein